MSRKIKTSGILMLLGRFNPPLCCVKILKDKTLNAQRESQPNLPYSSRAIEVKYEEMLIEVLLSM